MIPVKFKVKSDFGLKGEERLVTDRAAEMFFKKGLIEPYKEEKAPFETKEEKQVAETKEVKITKSPVEEAKPEEIVVENLIPEDLTPEDINPPEFPEDRIESTEDPGKKSKEEGKKKKGVKVTKAPR